MEWSADLLELAGTVEVPSDVRGMSWDEIREAAWEREWADRQDRRNSHLFRET